MNIKNKYDMTIENFEIILLVTGLLTLAGLLCTFYFIVRIDQKKVVIFSRVTLVLIMAMVIIWYLGWLTIF